MNNFKNKPISLAKFIATLVLVACVVLCLAVSAFADGSFQIDTAQRNFIMNQIDVWAPTDSYAGWQYTITDLDHNGRAEVICAGVQGSGLYTYYNVYEVSADGSYLIRGGDDLPEGYSFPDIMCSQADCFYNPSTGLYSYIFDDVIRNGYAETYMSKSAVSYADGLFRVTAISNGCITADADGNVTETYTYNGRSISESEYELTPDLCFTGMQKSTVTFDWYPVSERTRQAQEYSANGVTVTVTKNPTGECLGIGGRTWFIAHADNAQTLTWMLLSPYNVQCTLEQAMDQNPGLQLQALEGDTLAVSNVPQSFNGWAVYAVFANGDAYATTDPAYIYVGDYVTAYSAVINGYRNLTNGISDYTGLVQETDLDTTGVRFGYRFKDLNADGVPEIIVAAYNSGTCDKGDIIYSVYTLSNGYPKEVFHSWARNRYYYMGGSFLNEGSSGAAYSDTYILRVAADGSTYVTEGVYTDGSRQEIYFHVTNGDRYSGSSEAISESRYGDYANSYEACLCNLGMLTGM